MTPARSALHWPHRGWLRCRLGCASFFPGLDWRWSLGSGCPEYRSADSGAPSWRVRSLVVVALGLIVVESRAVHTARLSSFRGQLYSKKLSTRTPCLEANGLTHASLGQRLGNGTQQRPSPERAGQNHAPHYVSPFRAGSFFHVFPGRVLARQPSPSGPLHLLDPGLACRRTIGAEKRRSGSRMVGMSDASVSAERAMKVAMDFTPRIREGTALRRGATAEPFQDGPCGGFRRRSATRASERIHRGLKSTATVGGRSAVRLISKAHWH